MSDSEEDSKEKHLKLVVLGEQNVGKTNLVKKYCHDEFSRIYVPTIGANFYVKRISLAKNKDIIVRITDVSGSECTDQMLGTYLFKANIVILLYDLTNKKSFDSLTSWLRKIDQILRYRHGENRHISIVIVGNKCDLEHRKIIRPDEAKYFARENKLYSYVMSAKTGENVNFSFADVVARYFNLRLNSLDVDKQNPILEAEITPYTPPVVQCRRKFSSKKTKDHNMKKVALKSRGLKLNRTCAIQ
ncbi:ras-related protein Rab-28-like [Euwallacea fornicatus]|uniref:ras-related protein Rab-28-like n=1 Tax=Euwallacea fornicatus TaxID=995702 RepID=UPI00338F8520